MIQLYCDIILTRGRTPQRHSCKKSKYCNRDSSVSKEGYTTAVNNNAYQKQDSAVSMREDCSAQFETDSRHSICTCTLALLIVLATI